MGLNGCVSRRRDFKYAFSQYVNLMSAVVQPASKKEKSSLEDLQANEFASGVIRGIKEFKAGKGKGYRDKDEFLNSLREL